jgi:hypothetical protein
MVLVSFCLLVINAKFEAGLPRRLEGLNGGFIGKSNDMGKIDIGLAIFFANSTRIERGPLV